MSHETIILDDAMAAYITAYDEEQINEEAPGWYERWRSRIYAWASDNLSNELAHWLLFVPDLFMLVLRLIRDKRVPLMVKSQLLLASAYVLTPLDLLPEGVMGPIGLADDLGVLTLVLLWFRSLARLDKRILYDNWSGNGSPEAAIHDAHDWLQHNADRLFSNDVWQTIQRQFKHKAPKTIRTDRPALDAAEAPTQQTNKKRRWPRRDWGHGLI
jgi:uncharacterized membrane protein YkvA (DUF1232 family)